MIGVTIWLNLEKYRNLHIPICREFDNSRFVEVMGRSYIDGMLLYDDGIVKGVISGQLIGDTIIEITDFYAEPFFVGQGIGTLLIEYLIQQVRKKGVRKIVLWVIKDNMKARKFYEANGFVNSGKTCIIEGTIKEDCCYEYVFE